MGVAMAKVMGHVALGLCESERPASLAIDEAQLPAGSTLMVCPIGCAVTSVSQAGQHGHPQARTAAEQWQHDDGCELQAPRGALEHGQAGIVVCPALGVEHHGEIKCDISRGLHNLRPQRHLIPGASLK